MFNPRNIALHAELLQMAQAKTAGLDPSQLKMLLAAGAGATAIGVPAAMMHAHDKREQVATRNRAFGAGIASGAVAPHVIRNLFDIAQQNHLMAPAEGY